VSKREALLPAGFEGDTDIDHIRNFCIVAHIDHGKSTLADRFLLMTGAIAARDFHDQYLDAHSIERERGITIKAKAVEMKYTTGGREYQLNLIDTPGHVDFTYEVSRSLAACEAQTVANAYLAVEAGLTIIPVINKIDSPLAHGEEVIEEMKNSLGINREEILMVSAKDGAGVPELLDHVIKRVQSPEGSADSPLQALIFDSVYDDYRGVVLYVRVRNGRLRRGSEILMMQIGRTFDVEEVGKFHPKMAPCDSITAGEVGYVMAKIRDIHDIKIGDTITEKGRPATEALAGYKEPVPMVFCGLYPTIDSDFNSLKRALERLSLNDSSFKFEPETSEALGFGFRAGFLGLLHMDIVRERLERDQNASVVQTAPNVTYEVVVQEGKERVTKRIDNPAELPEEQFIIEIREPMAHVALIVPSDVIGSMMQFCEERRGRYRKTEYISPTRAILTYDLPLAEIIFDFYDKMKSATRGYGTMDYVVTGFVAADLVKLRIIVASEEVDALSSVIHSSQAESKGRKLIQILRKEIPRHVFQVALQAAVGGRIIARENIAALSKNVTARCSGGDITRKRKLWAKQREGKKKLKTVGEVEIPQKAFMAVLTGNPSKPGKK
jgi:GTP-binding protein LepA